MNGFGDLKHTQDEQAADLAAAMGDFFGERKAHPALALKAMEILSAGVMLSLRDQFGMDLAETEKRHLEKTSEILRQMVGP